MAFSIVLYGHHILVRMLVEKRVNNENQTPKPHSEVLLQQNYPKLLSGRNPFASCCSNSYKVKVAHHLMSTSFFAIKGLAKCYFY